MNIYPVGTELFHSDGKGEEQTGRHDEIFRLFRPTVLCGSHSWANLLVLTLADCQLLLKCTALASAYEI